MVVIHRPTFCQEDQSSKVPITSATMSKVLGIRTAFPSSNMVRGELFTQDVVLALVYACGIDD